MYQLRQQRSPGLKICESAHLSKYDGGGDKWWLYLEVLLSLPVLATSRTNDHQNYCVNVNIFTSLYMPEAECRETYKRKSTPVFGQQSSTTVRVEIASFEDTFLVRLQLATAHRWTPLHETSRIRRRPDKRLPFTTKQN